MVLDRVAEEDSSPQKKRKKVSHVVELDDELDEKLDSGYTLREIRSFHIVLTQKIRAASTPGLSQEEAFKEWKIERYIPFPHGVKEHKCICGHPLTHGANEIKNLVTGQTLYPIGSTCVRRMGGDLVLQLKEMSKIQCECGSVLANQTSYKIHLGSEKHIRFFWPVCDACRKKTDPEELREEEGSRLCDKCLRCSTCKRFVQKNAPCQHCAVLKRAGSTAHGIGLCVVCKGAFVKQYASHTTCIPCIRKPSREPTTSSASVYKNTPGVKAGYVTCASEGCATTFKKRESWCIYCYSCYLKRKNR
jgi:hypothetical protein